MCSLTNPGLARRSLVFAAACAVKLAGAATLPLTAGAQAACMGKGVQFCDDFESASPGGPPDSALWAVGGANCLGTGSLAVDGSVAHRGKQSLRVDGMGGYCNHIFAAAGMPAPLEGRVFGRFFVRFATPLGDGHVTFLAMKDAADNQRDLRMGGQSKVLMWNRESDDATLPVLSPNGIAQSVAPATDAWHCVEFVVDGGKAAIKTWFDGALVAGLVVDSTPTPDVDAVWLTRTDWHPSLADFRLGWESYAGQPMTLWFDDVALGKKRIRCAS